ncbi:hypothetical protein Ari01nite_52470 [Paractinoplanes rishiriensis]|uniref:Uncharacterized protein n=1 Tax=Paractinoplanes rishiriensis TaxID=1050105 RepID=A0A919K2Q4_9ACTN|nr:hypothetical protein Ari01nite_52470 [Actinoplanes rishiriensis]
MCGPGSAGGPARRRWAGANAASSRLGTAGRARTNPDAILISEALSQRETEVLQGVVSREGRVVGEQRQAEGRLVRRSRAVGRRSG